MEGGEITQHFLLSISYKLRASPSGVVRPTRGEMIVQFTPPPSSATAPTQYLLPPIHLHENHPSSKECSRLRIAGIQRMSEMACGSLDIQQEVILFHRRMVMAMMVPADYPSPLPEATTVHHYLLINKVAIVVG